MKFAYLFCRYYYLIYWPLMLWAFVGNHDYSLCLGLTRPVNALLMPMVQSYLPQPLKSLTFPQQCIAQGVHPGTRSKFGD